MEFRPGTPADAKLLATLNKQLIEDEGHRNRMSVEQLTDRMRGWLQGEYRATIFIYTGEVAGYALYRPEADHVYIRQFFVARTHRRRGIGRAAIAWLRKHEWADAPRLRLDVLTGNPHGIAFWRAMGFSDYCLMMESPVQATTNNDRVD